MYANSLSHALLGQVLKQRKSTEVDNLADDLKARFAENGCPLPFVKKADFIYQLGNRRVNLSAVSSKLVGEFLARTHSSHQQSVLYLLNVLRLALHVQSVCTVRMGGGYTDFLEFLESARF